MCFSLISTFNRSNRSSCCGSVAERDATQLAERSGWVRAVGSKAVASTPKEHTERFAVRIDRSGRSRSRRIKPQ